MWRRAHLYGLPPSATLTPSCNASQVVGDVLPQILTLLCGFAKRPHERLAAVGVEALGRLLRDAGPLLKPQDWDLVLASLKEAVGDTLPDVYSLVGPPSAPLPEEQPEQQGADPGEGERARFADGAQIKVMRSVIKDMCLRLLIRVPGRMWIGPGMRSDGPDARIIYS